MADKCMKICSTTYVTRELEIKTTKYKYTSVRVAKTTVLTTTCAGENVGQQEQSFIVRMHCGTATLEDNVEVPYKS